MVHYEGPRTLALALVTPGLPDPRGLLFDRDDVVKAVQSVDLLDGRIELVGGSLFNDEIPRCADIYLLIRVLHDWPDEDSKPHQNEDCCLRHPLLRRGPVVDALAGQFGHGSHFD